MVLSRRPTCTSPKARFDLWSKKRRCSRRPACTSGGVPPPKPHFHPKEDGNSILFQILTPLLPPPRPQLCSRIMVNLAMEIDNHDKMVNGGMLDVCSYFLGGEDEENKANARKVMSMFGNTVTVLKQLLTHSCFDVYASLTMNAGAAAGGGEEARDLSNLLTLSRVFLNCSLQQDCCKTLLKKPYFEEHMIAFSLKTEELNWNTVKIIKRMVENKESKAGLLKTGAAGIMSRVSQATKDAVLKKLCGKILNGMSSRKSTVTYSEGR